MELFQGDIIPVDDYQEHRKERIQPEDLEIDEAVFLMMAVRRRQPGLRPFSPSHKALAAFRLTAVVEEVERKGNNFYEVSFDVYDSSMQWRGSLHDWFVQGLWEPTVSSRWIDANNRIVSGYFWDYNIDLPESDSLPHIDKYSPVG